MKPKFDLSTLATGIAATLFALGSPGAIAQGDTTKDDAREVENIVVTGSRLEQNIEDVAGSISVMTNVDIEKQMVTNMSQLFRYEPGVYVTGSSGSAQNIVVRGMGADRVLMTKDGMRMNEGYGADGLNDIVGRGFIDVDMIKRVEVAKGAASSLYGADALGGIVAFSTIDPSDVLRGESFFMSLNADADGRSSETGVGIQGAVQTGRLATVVSYKMREGNETQNYADTRPHQDIESDSVILKSVFEIGDARNLAFVYSQFNQDVATPDDGSPKGEYQGLDGWTINLQDTMSEKSNESYQLQYRQDDLGWGIVDSLFVNAYLNETDQKDSSRANYETPLPLGPGGSRDDIKDYLFEQKTTGVNVSMGKNAGTHDLSYGFDWDVTETRRPESRTRIQSIGTVTGPDSFAPFPKSETERYGVYLQDSIDVGERFTVVPGLRYDHYTMTPLADPLYDEANPDPASRPKEISDSNVSGRLGLVFDIAENSSLFLQASEGFKVPPYDLAFIYHDNFAAFPYWYRLIPADDLVPEESDSFELGLRGSTGPIGYSVAAYQSNYKNFIQIGYVDTVTEMTPYGFPWELDIYQYQNVEAVEISGLELQLEHDISDNVHLWLNVERMDGKDKGTGEKLRTLQPLRGTLGLQVDMGSVGIQTMMRWADSMSKTPEGALTTAGFATIDAYAQINLTDKLFVNLGVINLLDKEYIEYSRIGGIPDDGRDLTLYTEPGRTFSAKLKYDF